MIRKSQPALKRESFWMLIFWSKIRRRTAYLKEK